MSFDFFKNFMSLGDEERFSRICEGIEEVVREIEAEAGEDQVTDLDIMQALDFVGYNLFRDNWEEFKRMDLNRDLSYLSGPQRDKNYIH